MYILFSLPSTEMRSTMLYDLETILLNHHTRTSPVNACEASSPCPRAVAVVVVVVVAVVVVVVVAVT